MKHIVSRVLATIILVCTSALVALSQNVTASIAGVAKDPSGAAVPSITVIAINEGTSARFQTTTDSDGQYTIRAVPVGVYRLTAEMQGFKRFESGGIRLQVNEVARVDINLAIGTATETVTVSSQALAVDTSSATLKTVVDQKRIEDLPLNGRNPTQLMRLVAGVQIAQGSDVTSGTTYPGVQGVSVNGGRANATNYVLDGAQNNDHYTNAPNPMPSPDALQEFSVQTNNFSAEFGRQGGGLVNAVTKSGTNEFHGVVFEYLRNKSVNAANRFAPFIKDANGRDVKVDDGLKRNQYGFTFGGPVLIPKLYNGKNKSFFFFSYQGQKLRRVPSSTNNIVPTAAQKAGDFSELLPGKALRDPFGGGVYPNNRIPLSQFNPISKTIADSFLPTPVSGNRISYSTVSNYDDDQILIRGDQQITSKNRLSGRFYKSWALTPGHLDPANYLAVVTARTWDNRSVSVSDTHVISPRVLNSFLFAYNHTDGPVSPIYPSKSIADLGAKMYNDKQPQYHLTVAGYFGTLNTGDTNNFFRDEYQFSDTVRWSRGKHQFTFGGEVGHGVGDVVNNFRANGQFAWNGSAPFTTDSLADFFIGKFFTMVQGIGEYKNTRFNILALYADDSWKVTRRFTLNLGVRWDPYFPYTDSLGKLSAWRPGQQSTRYPNAPRGVLYPGDPGLPDGGFNTAWNNIAPRVGFAYDVFGDGKTSIRGGYGIFFDRVSTLSTNSAATQGPFGTVVSLNGNAANSFTDPYAGATNPFPAPLNPPSTVRFVLPHTAFLYEEHMRNPNLQSFNLTLERQVAGGFITRVAYAGSKGTRLFSGRELNPAIYAVGATTATTNQRRLYAPLGFGNMTLIEPVSNSTFHSLQLTAERRFSKGFSLLANYMWSKSIDDGSANKGNSVSHSNPFNTGFDKGPSDFDHTHVFTASGLWELPVRFDSKAVNTLLGGWNLTSIVTLQSGYPFTVGSGVDNARSGTGGQRADLIGDPYISGNRSRDDVILQYLSKAAFAPNALGTFGNLGRNRFRGPGLASLDMGLHKSFRITERVNTQFRFEAFNAINKVNLNNPTAAQNSGNFMRITGAGEPRILQFALRFSF
ncbi:MAG: carboxypeptidase regulatory-like domain-containing protein [Acidobacteria bacterium]|nr:carboxypeptidase regulatory-like domain-containing protein [Acidobacteriota bacterium]